MNIPIWPYDGPLPHVRAKWRYTGLHVPTGARVDDITQEATFAAFLLELNRWNRTSPGVWQYYWNGKSWTGERG